LGKLRELIDWAMGEQIRRLKEENVTRESLEKHHPDLMKALDKIAEADNQKRESLGDYRPKPIPVLKGKEADRFIEIEKNPLTIDEKKDLEECLNLFRKRERT